MKILDRPSMSETQNQILHPGSRQLFRYWESLRAERPCPRKDEIELKRIIEVVPNLAIIERDPTQKGWQFRLAGTKIYSLFGKEMTNGDVLQGFDSFERGVAGNCLDICLTRMQPCLVRMRFILEHNVVVAAEMIGLPVRDGNDSKVQIFGGLFPFHDGQPGGTTAFLRRELASARMIWTEHDVGDMMLGAVGRKAPPQFQVIQGGLR